jgi:hypothetical protein
MVPDPVQVIATVQNAFGDHYCLVAKQAAELCEERLIYDLTIGEVILSSLLDGFQCRIIL